MSTETGTSLRVSRIIKAAPETVFLAWTEPDQMGQWSAPEGMDILADVLRFPVHDPAGMLVVVQHGSLCINDGHGHPHAGQVQRGPDACREGQGRHSASGGRAPAG